MNFSSPDSFIQNLLLRGIKIWAERDNVRVYVPVGNSINDYEVVYIKQEKQKILKILISNNLCSDSCNKIILKSKFLSRPELSYGQERLWFIDRYETG
ncbi:MAG: hypothetical protein WCP46_06570, partial [Alphaproteobacteria bacterium]